MTTYKALQKKHVHPVFKSARVSLINILMTKIQYKLITTNEIFRTNLSFEKRL